MLNERERRVLARIERQLRDTDPEFVGLFARLGRGVSAPARSMHAAGPVPCFLLVAGLVLLVLGSVTAVAPVAATGVLLAVLSLGVARSSPAGGSSLGFA